MLPDTAVKRRQLMGNASALAAKVGQSQATDLTLICRDGGVA
jgi:hypothetical protein